MNIVTVLTLVQAIAYIVLCIKSNAIFFLIISLWQKTTVLPRPSLIDYEEGNYTVWVSVVIFHLSVNVLFRIFWLLRGCYCLLTMGTVPRGTRNRRRFREFAHARYEPAKYENKVNNLRHRVIKVDMEKDM